MRVIMPTAEMKDRRDSTCGRGRDGCEVRRRRQRLAMYARVFEDKGESEKRA